MRTIVAGHICLDLTPSLPAGLDIRPGTLREVGPLAVSAGGCVYNTGSALAALGIPVRLSAQIGQDALGDLLDAQLRREGLDADLTRSEAHGTSYSIVLEPPGEDRSFWHHVGACGEFDGSRVLLDDAEVLHLGYPSLLPALTADGGRPLTDLLTRARSAGMLTSVDLAVVDRSPAAPARDWPTLLSRICALTDVLTPSIDDLRSAFDETGPATDEDVEERAEWAIAQGAAIVSLSAGSRGSYLAVADRRRLRHAPAVLSRHAEEWAGHRGWIAATPVDDAVTTNGAGDAHSAGFLAALLRGHDPRTAGHHGGETARARIQGLPVGEPADR